MKLISVILIHICANFGVWADETDLNKNSIEAFYVSDGDVASKTDANIYTINDVIYRPAFLVKILRRRISPSSNPQSLNTLENINIYPNTEEDITDNRRLIRSAFAAQSPEAINVNSEDDLSLAESSIPFHPLFAIRHRKEVKRRYGYRRY
ncbi:hypothetical protein QE152_g5623 [Popillia japonica]|uniref:Uncharacterized protein n=1 Tax=Popillia japonica TaxID=7064 RepID=A0AAW1MM09_POPJA